MNHIQYKYWVSALLSTLPYSDSQNIRSAVASLTHDDDLSDPDLSPLGRGTEGDLYAFKVEPDYLVMLRRPTGEPRHLEVIDLVKEDAFRTLRETLSASVHASR